MFYANKNVPNVPGRKHRGRYGEQTYPGADYTDEELEWLRAVDKRKLKPNDVRGILKMAYSLGYRKVA